ncbi:MAG: hypothetical protein HQ503_16475 [Rhodospirillales bacterium]|nr:hypothetical protein [Rhodospirillales bacterium]
MSVALFFLKNEVTNLEMELDNTNRTIVSDREAIHVLKAEWSHLNDIERLQALSGRYLKLEPTDPGRLQSMDEFMPREGVSYTPSNNEITKGAGPRK